MALPDLHQTFLDRLLAKLPGDARFDAVLGAGSLALGQFDAYSDLDLVLVVRPEAYDEVMAARDTFAAGLGDLLTAFTGEHVGEPRLLICLYGPPLLHVDVKFVRAADLTDIVERPVSLWARDPAAMTAVLDSAHIAWPNADAQWFEDRAWTWLHYGAAKLKRGELFEAVAMIAFFEERVLGPLYARRHGRDQRGLRRIEALGCEVTGQLARLHVAPDPVQADAALRLAAELYLDLRREDLPARPTQHMPQALFDYLA